MLSSNSINLRLASGAQRSSVAILEIQKLNPRFYDSILRAVK